MSLIISDGKVEVSVKGRGVDAKYPCKGLKLESCGVLCVAQYEVMGLGLSHTPLFHLT